MTIDLSNSRFVSGRCAIKRFNAVFSFKALVITTGNELETNTLVRGFSEKKRRKKRQRMRGGA
jgi:hypothetical protein